MERKEGGIGGLFGEFEKDLGIIDCFHVLLVVMVSRVKMEEKQEELSRVQMAFLYRSRWSLEGL